jgi:CubicO group peptidase (beta-lactamase class C family)
MKHVIIFFVLLCMLSACLSVRNSEQQEIRNFIDSLIVADNFNGNVLAASDNEIMYKKSVGLADVDTQRPLNDSSVFLLCSISKQFTAMGIMMLKERAQLRYDDNIRHYLPELPYENITVRHLLTHTSGLPKYEEFLVKRMAAHTVATNRDIIIMFQEMHPPLLFPPGSKWEYSDTGYELLATIIERISGKSYGDFLKENIFYPLKMNNTFNCITRRAEKLLIPNHALPFVFSDSLNKYIAPDSLPQHRLVILLDGTQGAGSINSTVDDMYTWDRTLRSDKLVTKSSLDEAFSPVVLQNGQTFDYGFGWFLIHLPAGKAVMHPGGWPGYKTFIIRSVEQDRVVIVLSNNESDAQRMATRIFEKMSR